MNSPFMNISFAFILFIASRAFATYSPSFSGFLVSGKANWKRETKHCDNVYA